jgi:hypothetical protein
MKIQMPQMMNKTSNRRMMIMIGEIEAGTEMRRGKEAAIDIVKKIKKKILIEGIN